MAVPADLPCAGTAQPRPVRVNGARRQPECVNATRSLKTPAQALPMVIARAMDAHDTTPDATPPAEGPLDLYVFDFDGTLTTEDTFVGFMKYDMGTARWLARMARLTPVFVAYKLGRTDRHAVKRAVVKAVFTGRTLSEVEASAESYARDIIPALIRPAGMERFRERWADTLAGGPRTVVCSASISPYLEAFFADFEGLEIVCCRLRTDPDGTCTGDLDGMNVWGPQKIEALHAHYAERGLNIVEAYGDSEGDRALLDAAERPFWRPFRGFGES